MTIVIKKKATKIEVEKLLSKIDSIPKKKSLRNGYGAFPIEGDAVEIQKKTSQ
jgi:hypothetical protein